MSKPSGYVELASPQLLGDKWRELNFDMASGQNVLQELVTPESGGGYVYHDAGQIGSATHNRILYWKTANDTLELVEVSPEVVLDGNQVRLRFANSPVISSISVIEFPDSVVIMVATATSVHRLNLNHPKTTNRSILYDLNPDVLFNPSNYYILNNQNSTNIQQPICAASWYDKSLLKCSVSFPDSSILIVQFGKNHHHISTSEIKQIGMIGRLWSRMPNLLARHPNDCDNAVFVCIPYTHPQTSDVLLFTLCRDCKIRVFSTSTRECVYTRNVIPQSSFSQSFASHTNPTTELPMMKMFDSYVLIYLTENRPEFVLFEYSYEDGTHELRELSTVQTPNWEKLIDFSLTREKIWALANIRESESTLCYMNMQSLIGDENERESGDIEEVWDFVYSVDELEMPSIKNYVAEIFWRNRFSITTVQKALFGIIGPSIPKKSSMESLEELAFTRLVDDNQEEAWARFYNYCLQNHHAANKNIGLITSEDEVVIGIVKGSNPSFVCPWLISPEMILHGHPYRGIKFSKNLRAIIEPLNYISNELIDDEHSYLFEQKIFENPGHILSTTKDLVESLSQTKGLITSRLNFKNLARISAGIDFISEELDLTVQAREYGSELLKETSTRIRAGHYPLESNSGIILTFELFKRLVRARMILARDLLVYVHLMDAIPESEESNDKDLKKLHKDLFLSAKVKRIADSLRCYAILVWISEAPIKTQALQANQEVINYLSNSFKFFKKAVNASEHLHDSTLEVVVHQNLFMNFLVKEGSALSCPMKQLSARQLPQTLSNSFYVTDIALNLCKLMWPQAGHLCFVEFLFTHQLDEHLEKYLDLAEDWLTDCEHDRNFIKASNLLIQNRTNNAVDIFNRLWMNVNNTNLLGRFLNLDSDKTDPTNDDAISVTPAIIFRYYDKLIQLFQLDNNYQCQVLLINNCMIFLDENADKEQEHWINCFRAKLFQSYLELEDPDEAYNTMVLTSDLSLRNNCLRKFIVSHCEKEQWSKLLSYPFIDIKNDFIDILNQKAKSSDLSELNSADYFKTTFYELLFASFVADDEFRCAAEIMYNYAQRLAHEVPGIISIRKQADCLLIALNSLRCVEEKEAFIESGSNYPKEEGRSSVLKRAYDCESNSSFSHQDGENSMTHMSTSRVSSQDIRKQYELTWARVKLLRKDQTANAIALSPLTAEETIAQLVTSSMYSSAIDLALLFKCPMEPILEGLTAKYIFVMRLSAVDIALHHDLADIFTDSYSIIDTYNYIANSTSTFVDKLWRLIDYYLTTYDGISHRYSSDTFSDTFTGTTVLMRIVAAKLLSAGCDIPASLKRMYMARNTAELLRLLIKYNKLVNAANLAIEMIDILLEPKHSLTFASSLTTEPPPVYLPTHLILQLISLLNEDATILHKVESAKALAGRMNKFRKFIESS